jgi:hypothetical protein
LEPATGPSPGDFPEPLWDAIHELKLGKLSRLTRVVRDLANDVQQPSAILLERQPQAPSPTGGFVFNLLCLSASEHRLLDREAEKKDPWAWFLRWREAALDALDPGVSGRKVLDLLKRALSAARQCEKPSAPHRRRTPAGQLLRLAKSIVPHAPPRRLSLEPLTSKAG